MATKKSSAEKRHAQSEVRRLHNKAIKSSCKTYARKYLEAVQAKDKTLAETRLRTLVSELDSARGKGVLTRNAVSRKKSRMMKLFNVSFAAEAAK
ncbi:MAG: 30S ribosomal protein S20 [Treponema sp.]